MTTEAETIRRLAADLVRSWRDYEGMTADWIGDEFPVPNMEGLAQAIERLPEMPKKWSEGA